MVVVLGQEEARYFNHDHLGTEHLLLGLLRVEEGLASRVLESLGVTPEDVRDEVARVVGFGEHEAATGQIPFTPRAKKVLELALREATALGTPHIGPEHILLGIARENGGVASRILLGFDVDADRIRKDVVPLLSRPAFPRRTPVPDGLGVAPYFEAEILRVRREKERAVGLQEYKDAARLWELERRLFKLARAEDAEGFWELAGGTPPAPPPGEAAPGEMPTPPAVRRPLPAVAAGSLVFGVALGLGILIGRLVWG